MATAGVIATSGSRRYTGRMSEDNNEDKKDKEPKKKKPPMLKRIIRAFKKVIDNYRDLYSAEEENKQ
nr:MAG TPA: hypothetical protein [Caudoviricetes sp.]